MNNTWEIVHSKKFPRRFIAIHIAKELINAHHGLDSMNLPEIKFLRRSQIQSIPKNQLTFLLWISK